MSAELLIAPATRDESPPLVELGDASTRAELTRAAVPALARLAEGWRLSTDQMCGLLGGIAPSTWYAWKNASPRELSIDQLTRASYLLGIYTALHALFRDPLADQWVGRANTNPLFGGATPIDVMTSGGIVALAQVRALLDGARGGV